MAFDKTTFWENAALLLSIVQFLLYLKGFKKYEEILTELANKAEEFADERAKAYESLRNRDTEFFEYYCNLPLYKECESNIRRSRGYTDYKYGSNLRRAGRAVNGYTRMSMVGLSESFSRDTIAESANRRVVAKIAERARVDDHVLKRWDAIISAPTNAAIYVNLSTGIEASFKALGAFGQGVNSAGMAIGSILYNYGSGRNDSPFYARR